MINLLSIQIICVGKIKEKYLRKGIEEYTKRISKYAKLNIYEVKDEPTIENASDKEIEGILLNEYSKIDKILNDNTYIIALCIEGKTLDSVEFSEIFQQCAVSGKSNITIIIGGSLGLHENIKNKASLKLSFSKLTFPHQLMRLILLEQIYRGFRIAKGEPYHK